MQHLGYGSYQNSSHSPVEFFSAKSWSNTPLIRSFIWTLIHLYIHLFIQPFIYSYIHTIIQLFDSCIQLFIHTNVYSFIYSFICSYIHSLVHSSIQSFICSYFHLYIHSYTFILGLCHQLTVRIRMPCARGPSLRSSRPGSLSPIQKQRLSGETQGLSWPDIFGGVAKTVEWCMWVNK